MGSIPLSLVMTQTGVWLTSAGLGLVQADRISLIDAMPKQLAHKGFTVDIPSTVVTPRTIGRSVNSATDQIEVQVVYRIRPHEQIKSRGEALDLNDQVIQRLSTNTDGQFYRLDYITTKRGRHPKSAEYYLTRLTFRLPARVIDIGDC